MRTYERTHPWLTFSLDLQHAPPSVWLLLGEAQSKTEHLAGVPLLPGVQERLHEVYLAKGILATTAIEGNTLSEDQVRDHLAGRLRLPPSKEYLQQEIENIVQACNSIATRMLGGGSDQMSVERLQDHNRVVLTNLAVPDEVEPGVFRKHDVRVGRYPGAPWDDLGVLVPHLCEWLNTGFPPQPGREKAIATLKAIMAHLYIAWIHPFGDGNGRTARLVELEILLSAGVPTVAAHLLSNHYNQTRSEYYRQLDKTHRAGGDPMEFIEYALQGFVDGLREQIETVKAQQLAVHWINYIHERFKGKDTPAAVRQRRLAIDLSESKEPVPRSAIQRITPRIAEAYAGKTGKTITRDLNSLHAMALIEKTPNGYRARSEIMRAFLPPARQVGE